MAPGSRLRGYFLAFVSSASAHLLSVSFNAFAGWKVSFRAAATLMVAPVPGLRASRSGVFLILNLPNPDIDVSAPDVAVAMMDAKTVSTIVFACALVRPC